MADIDIKAEAALSAFSLKDAIGDVDLTDAVGRVIYGNSRAQRHGHGQVRRHAVDIAWREQFGAAAPYRRRYELKGTVPAALIAKAGFPSPEPYVSGPIGVTSSTRSPPTARASCTAASTSRAPRSRYSRWAGRRKPGTEASSRLR